MKLERLREQFYLYLQTLHLWNLFTRGPWSVPNSLTYRAFCFSSLSLHNKSLGPFIPKVNRSMITRRALELHVFLASTANTPFIPARVSLGSLLSSITLHVLHVSLSHRHCISVTQLPFQEQCLLLRNVIPKWNPIRMRPIGLRRFLKKITSRYRALWFTTARTKMMPSGRNLWTASQAQF